MRRILLLAAWLLPLVLMAQPRPKIGLALGGGGAKGAATVGVLKVLEQAGIRPDYIAGTSIGAIVGGLYAAGYSAEELDTMFCRQQWLSLLTDRREDLSGYPYKREGGNTYVFGFPVVVADFANHGFGALRGERIEQVVDSMLGIKGKVEFEELPIPFRCVAAEMKTAREVVLKDGSLPRAMRASMAIPGLFKPADWQGMSLIDGGMMNNLPVDVVKDMGADIVIAVDLQQNEMRPRKERQNPLSGLTDLLGVGDMVDWVMNRPDIKKYLENKASADVYICPSLDGFEVSSFSHAAVEQMIAIGEGAARKQLPRLRTIAGQGQP